MSSTTRVLVTIAATTIALFAGLMILPGSTLQPSRAAEGSSLPPIFAPGRTVGNPWACADAAKVKQVRCEWILHDYKERKYDGTISTIEGWCHVPSNKVWIDAEGYKR